MTKAKPLKPVSNYDNYDYQYHRGTHNRRHIYYDIKYIKQSVDHLKQTQESAGSRLSEEKTKLITEIICTKNKIINSRYQQQRLNMTSLILAMLLITPMLAYELFLSQWSINNSVIITATAGVALIPFFYHYLASRLDSELLQLDAKINDLEYCLYVPKR